MAMGCHSSPIFPEIVWAKAVGAVHLLGSMADYSRAEARTTGPQLDLSDLIGYII